MPEITSILALGLALLALVFAFSGYSRGRVSRVSVATDYATLAEAIKSITALPATLEVTAPLTVSSHDVIPATLEVVTSGAGCFVKAPGGELEFQGSSLRAGSQVVFQGFAAGEIRFTGSRPRFRLEWFGARPNESWSGEINSQAWETFRRAISANATLAPYSQSFGAALELATGEYCFARPLDITRQIDLAGAGGGGRNRTTYLRFPPGSSGVVIHSDTSSSHLPDPGSGSWSHIHDLQIIGDPSAFDGAVDVAALVVTKASGADFSTPDLWHGTITIGSLAYTIKYGAAPTASRLEIEAPGFFVSGEQGSTILRFTGCAPGDALWASGTTFSVYLASGTLALVIKGMHDAWTAELNSPLEAGFTSAAMEIFDLRLASAPYRINRFHAVDQHVQARLTNVALQLFSGNGVHADSDRPGANCNLCYYSYCDAVNLAGHGFLMGGGNSQVNHLNTCSAENCGGWGFREQSAYSNVYTANHTSANYGGSYWKVDAIYNQSNFLGNYFESGQWGPYLGVGGISTGLEMGGYGGTWVAGSRFFPGVNTNYQMSENTALVNLDSREELLRTSTGLLTIAGSAQPSYFGGRVNVPRVDFRPGGEVYFEAGAGAQYHLVSAADGYLRLRDEMKSLEIVTLAPYGGVGIFEPSPPYHLSLPNWASFGARDTKAVPFRLIGAFGTDQCQIDPDARGVALGGGISLKTLEGGPSASDLPANQWGVFKDKATGRISLWANSEGELCEWAAEG